MQRMKQFAKGSVKVFVLAVMLSLSNTLFAQQQIFFNYPDSLFTAYYHQRVSHFNTLPTTNKDIVFLGNSITDGAEWQELFNDSRIKNRGISGDVTIGVLNRLVNVIKGKPAKIFLLIGVNDLSRNISPDSVFKNISTIASVVHNYSPATKLYIQSILPVNDFYKKFAGHVNKTEQINSLNKLIKENQEKYNYTYVNLHDSFCDESGKLNITFTNDGLHLKGEAYILWKHILFPYLYDIEKLPSLIPYPKNISWNNKSFPLWMTNSVSINDSGILKLNINSFFGKEMNIFFANSNNIQKSNIEISLSKVNAPIQEDEAYLIHVDSLKIEIKANNLKGLFYALQTFRQLNRDGVMIDGCDIIDWPSFTWRGYMTDVGRNFESIELLKQQIDVMSKYKMNVFHFHCTEDIAWRWQIKKYPQLTSPDFMLRDKGMFYSIEQIRELIQYCKDRFIMFVPELDMPGHSKSFERVMGYSMQSENGKKILSDILHEILNTYSLTYFHIGGDEVKIVDSSFIPTIEKIFREKNIETIGWKPGGNFDQKAILQLWMGNEKVKPDLKYIDSRHLYINHFDPFESVVTIFNRKIGDVDQQTKEVLGGEICLWNDRRVNNENDLVKQNPLYPSLITFAEKVWNSSNQSNNNDKYVSNVDNLTAAQQINFSMFEKRLMEHKKLYFENNQFPYFEQASSSWKIVGPFNNKGNLTAQFNPETKDFDIVYNQSTQKVIGNTIILKHWWYPMIKGVLDKPTENTTCYALRKLWSDDETLQPFWIGFDNFSRSTATNSPKEETWDNRQSAIWINNVRIQPPHWQHASITGNLETPLIDEGYEYRDPVLIKLKKGWNNILVKLPIGSFAGKDWNNPVKWMFTVAPVSEQTKK